MKIITKQDNKIDIRGEICKIISEMLDNPDKHEIYPTGKCYDQMEQFINNILKAERKDLIEKVEEGLKGLEIIIEDGSLKECKVYHEATKDFIINLIKKQ